MYEKAGIFQIEKTHLHLPRDFPPQHLTQGKNYNQKTYKLCVKQLIH